MLVEVAESSLSKDRRIKAALYAESGALEYWIVDLAAGAIEIYREAVDGAYSKMTRHLRGERIALFAFPDVSIAVEELLPPLR